MSRQDTAALRAKWDARYGDADSTPGDACVVLREHAHLLPVEGRALDLACGLGANALFLAQRGLEVTAWDLSPVAVRRVASHARASGLVIHADVRDVVARPPAPNSFDVIVVSYFWEPTLCPAVVAALNPNGLLFYQTFLKAALTSRGPSSAHFRLGENELLRSFSFLQTVVYREEALIGDLSKGLRDEVLLVGRKRAESHQALAGQNEQRQ